MDADTDVRTMLSEVSYHLLASLALIIVHSIHIGHPLSCACMTAKGVWLVYGNVHTLH